MLDQTLTLPDDPALLQPLHEHAGALTIPPDDLDEVTPTAAEHEQVPGERVLPQHRLGLCRERGEPLAHVGDARR